MIFCEKQHCDYKNDQNFTQIGDNPHVNFVNNLYELASIPWTYMYPHPTGKSHYTKNTSKNHKLGRVTRSQFCFMLWWT